jgi:hypothetical protein
LLSSSANVLAGKPTSDNVNGNSIGSKSFCGKGADIIVAGDVRPVLGEDFARERFDFAERDGFKAGVFSVISCPFKAKREAAYPAKKIEDAQLGHGWPFKTASAFAKLPCWRISASVT